MPENFANRYQTALSAGVTSGDLTGGVTSVTGIPARPFRAIISSEGANTEEIVLVTGLSGTTLTWTRAAEAIAGVQVASAHAIGATLTAIVTAAGLLNSNGVTHVASYLAFGGGADDTSEIQAAINAAGVNGKVQFAAVSYTVTAALTYLSGQTWFGDSGPQLGSGQTTIVASGFTGSVIKSANPSSDTINVRLSGITVDMGSTADVGFDLFRTSYSRLDRCFAFGTKAGAVGIQLDANVSNQCYFNVLDQCKSDMTNGVDLRFKSGANGNTVIGGKFGNAQTGVELLSLSAGNTFLGCYFETNAVRHVYLDSASNVFLGVHMETAPVGYLLTSNGSDTKRIGTTMASTVTVPVIDGSLSGLAHEDNVAGSRSRWALGMFRMFGNWLSTATNWFFDAVPFAATRTTLTADASLGAGTLTVASITTFANGNSISIGGAEDDLFETHVINGAPSGSTITLTGTLAAAHKAGTPVVLRATASSTFTFFRRTNTSGSRQIVVYPGDGSTNPTAVIDAATGDWQGGKLTLSRNSLGTTITAGANSPEGVVTAPIGSLFLRSNGGAGTTFWVKETGAGNTGWIAK